MDLKTLALVNSRLAGIGGAYALIETITVGAGGATSIARTAEPDETPYSFTALLVTLDLVGAELAMGVFSFAPMCGEDGLPGFSGIEWEWGAANLKLHFACELVNGIWRTFYVDADGRSEPFTDIVTTADCASIDGVTLGLDIGFAENGVIKIYGIRA